MTESLLEGNAGNSPGARVAIVQRPGSSGRDQDGWVARRTSESQLLLAVVDGAGIRVPLGEDNPPDSRDLTDVITASLTSEPSRGTRPTPSQRLLAANQAARLSLLQYPTYRVILQLLEDRPRSLPDALRELPEGLGSFLGAAFERVLGDISALDTRFLRLCLPACVATVVHLELRSRRVDFAHLGDSVLLRVTAESISPVSVDQMARFDELTIDVARQMVASGQADSIIAAASEPTVKSRDALNGVRHNYVREDGQAAPSEGCGVVNGLEQMAAFIQAGSFGLEVGESIALLSDGMALPLRLPEAGAVVPEALIQEWRSAVAQLDAAQLVAAIDAILGVDPTAAAFPRLKHRDDATAVMAIPEEM